MIDEIEKTNGDLVVDEDIPEDGEENQVTKFRNERDMITAWLDDYSQRTAQLHNLRERSAFLNGWLSAYEESEAS